MTERHQDVLGRNKRAVVAEALPIDASVQLEAIQKLAPKWTPDEKDFNDFANSFLANATCVRYFPYWQLHSVRYPRCPWKYQKHSLN